jgi:peptidylprolyl isomerase
MTDNIDGLNKIIIKEGNGRIVEVGNTILAHYTGKLEDGTIFDSSLEREPLKVQIGVGMLIEGWDKKIVGMKIGEHSEITIPSEMGYGEQGVPGVIPPNSKLFFTVEIIDIVD